VALDLQDAHYDEAHINADISVTLTALHELGTPFGSYADRGYLQKRNSIIGSITIDLRTGAIYSLQYILDAPKPSHV
jgi:hypothetical protein